MAGFIAFALRHPFSLFLVVYLAFSAQQIFLVFHPAQCRGRGCLRPILQRADRVDVRVWRPSEPPYSGRALLYEATGLDAYEAREASVVLPIPAALRRGEASELVLTAEVHRAGDRDNPPLATTRVRVVGPRKPPKRSAAMLLEKVVASDDSDGDGADSGLPQPDHNGEVPHLLYSGAAGGTIELRVVRDETWHATNYLPDGVAVGSSIDHRQRLYAPRNSSAQFFWRNSSAQFSDAPPVHAQVRAALLRRGVRAPLEARAAALVRRDAAAPEHHGARDAGGAGPLPADAAGEHDVPGAAGDARHGPRGV